LSGACLLTVIPSLILAILRLQAMAAAIAEEHSTVRAKTFAIMAMGNSSALLALVTDSVRAATTAARLRLPTVALHAVPATGATARQPLSGDPEVARAHRIHPHSA
jgi:hypothetical protein